MPATSAKSSQEFVPIKEVRDGVLVLKDGSLRTILMTSSINFALQSEDNQTAVIIQFQNFLNALDFSVQIFIQSRKMDIRPYLALLEERHKSLENELLKIQTREYIEFVRAFTENTNIMTKTFFIVIPFGSVSVSLKKGALDAFTGLIGKNKDKKTETVRLEAEKENFTEKKMQLQQRISVVEQGLTRCGLRVAHLGTEETIELFYKLFNPGETDKP